MRRRFLAPVAFIAAFCLLAGGAQAAQFVKFAGVDGESTDKDHKGWSDLSGFDHGYLRAMDSKKGAVAPVLGPMKLTKRLDSSSPFIAQSLLTGGVFHNLRIHVTVSTTDAGRVTFYEYELFNVRVADYAVGAAGEAIPTESIALEFDALIVTYWIVDAAGKKKNKFEYSYRKP